MFSRFFTHVVIACTLGGVAVGVAVGLSQPRRWQATAILSSTATDERKQLNLEITASEMRATVYFGPVFQRALTKAGLHEPLDGKIDRIVRLDEVSLTSFAKVTVTVPVREYAAPLANALAEEIVAGQADVLRRTAAVMQKIADAAGEMVKQRAAQLTRFEVMEPSAVGERMATVREALAPLVVQRDAARVRLNTLSRLLAAEPALVATPPDAAEGVALAPNPRVAALRSGREAAKAEVAMLDAQITGFLSARRVEPRDLEQLDREYEVALTYYASTLARSQMAAALAAQPDATLYLKERAAVPQAPLPPAAPQYTFLGGLSGFLFAWLTWPVISRVRRPPPIDDYVVTRV